MRTLPTPSFSEATLELHRESLLVDLHVDFILQKRLFGYDAHRLHEPWMRRQPLWRHADFPRMEQGGYNLAVMGIHYWPFESDRGWREAHKQLEVMHGYLREREDVLLAESARDVRKAAENDQLAIMAGIEGAHILNGRLELVSEARALGAVYLTLTHFSSNKAATAAQGLRSNRTSGLTSFGRDLVQTLNEHQILVDVAHVNRQGVLDACECSTAPVIASHSCAFSLHETERALTDEGLAAIAETGGVVGVIFAPHFLTGSLDASVDAVLDHILYIGEKVGFEHVAIGTDFDGWIPAIPNDMRDCRDMPLVTERLLERGLSKDTVKGILGQNFLRVLSAVRP